MQSVELVRFGDKFTLSWLLEALGLGTVRLVFWFFVYMYLISMAVAWQVLVSLLR